MRYLHTSPLLLESGAILPQIEIEYQTFGNPNAAKVIWICHALTANADPTDWWSGWIGEGKFFDTDPEKSPYFIVCANILGSCYGSTYALSPNPVTGKVYGYDFPLLTTRDMAAAHCLLRQHLQIEQIYLLMGGSLGGQQAMEWAILEPKTIENLVLIATNARHSPWGIAFNEAQRMAIQADQTWQNPTQNPQNFDPNDPALFRIGAKGLAAARAIALISYRNAQAYNQTQKETENDLLEGFKAVSYQQYQGEKLVRRFDAFAYWTLSKAMDSHNVGRNRQTVAQALTQIEARTLCIGISSDLLFPPAEVQFLAQNIRKAQYVEINSDFGHDGFLLEYEQLEAALARLLTEKVAKDKC
ncbi:homoserine O-acetyltransferase family protein [Hugenholtzia roseola]|uniref:homoserine O-acetyltransferase family protein n=1 Tax=Hugenholtzia roseola TaxID=1002 RepID=UPI000409AA4D|nr:homoserine O-acetyltransferase [Hugenholtzia roseola]